MYPQGEYDVADLFHRRALEIDEKVFGADHPEVASDLKNWADSLFEQVKFCHFSRVHLLFWSS